MPGWKGIAHKSRGHTFAVLHETIQHNVPEGKEEERVKGGGADPRP